MVPEVGLEWFFDNVLPQLPEGVKMEKVIEELKKDNALNDHGWTQFPVDPKKERRHEDLVFAQLEPIFEAVVRAVKTINPSLTQQFALLVKPKTAPKSERRSNTKPDNCFIPVTVDERIKVDSTYRRKTKRRRKNLLPLGTMGWVLTTEPCDYLKDCERLIHLFIAFAYSSRTALGWDPTVECINTPDLSKGEKRRYKIKIGDRVFTILATLADYAAESPVSRATRAWLFDEDRPAEHEVREALPEDVKREREEEDVDGRVDTANDMMNGKVSFIFSQFSLKIVPPTDPRRQSYHPSRSHTVSSTSSYPPTNFPFPLPELTNVSELEANAQSSEDSDLDEDSPSSDGSESSDTGKNEHEEAEKDNLKAIVIRRKYHYCIVFEEHGSTLYQERSLLNVYVTLVDLLSALQIIHRSNWVHSDINCGNVYGFLDTSGQPRGILEYAKHVMELQEHPLRTGTPDLMAIESITAEWYFLPRKRFVGQISKPKPVVFSHNALHDLVSLWWLLVYILFNNDNAAKILKPDRANARNEKSKSLFGHVSQRHFRFEFFRDTRKMTVKEMGIHRSPGQVLQTVSDMADLLLSAYDNAEMPYFSIDQKALFIHETLSSFLEGPNRVTIQGIRLQAVELYKVQKPKPLPGESGARVNERKPERSRSHLSQDESEESSTDLDKDSLLSFGSFTHLLSLLIGLAFGLCFDAFRLLHV
ncbi:hypothetical protein GYMLUDRAFT_243561 [Collybiopsis luxurians FD-317 M1]|uniref:Fungal-type protein kinase domain-containing protein n=1 Tax=Collybiopsis luxurians FD-317 M1 TaxID=944289 RepID=A0A0D0CYE9_9AGAR|nr:hypothetical protein GYMLUDRAFT_243561 [Collybiopsis luxurians FD-317 M1]